MTTISLHTVTLHRGRAPGSVHSGRQSGRAVGIWLLCIAFLVFVMVVVGGITRLTESGLSMVEWRPVTGIIPPLSDKDWLDAFNAYRQYPEYQVMNRGMTLAQFKTIFWWEYAHRVLGRLIGLTFAVPLFIFWIRRRIPKGYGLRLAGILVLGGAQGALGWFMVKSGLIDHPEVSHYRLTAHLTLAFVIFAALLWTAFDILSSRRPNRDALLRRWGYGLLVLVFLQIVLGGLVAGLKAGYVFNTWPLMEGRFIPQHALSMSPIWQNFLDNTALVQFNHRMGAYLLFVVSLLLFVSTLTRRVPGRTRFLAGLVFCVLCIQLVIGIQTVLFGVPIVLGALHQAGGLVVLSATLAFVHRHRNSA